MPNSASHVPAVLIWDGKELLLLDQTRLPAEEAYLRISQVAALEDAIQCLAVRGAPAIGCAGAFGVLLAAKELAENAVDRDWVEQFNAACEHLAMVRPTAVNLGWAVERCRKRGVLLAQSGSNLHEILAALEREAQEILEEDRGMCAAIGENGVALLERILGGRDQATLITHCNAGALATAGSGTALAVMYAAAARGIRLRVYADETRPLLQGARLTSWELTRSGIETTVICDNMSASVMRQFKIDAAIVGADRIASNGDAANKIGTYGLAIIARHHGVPFWVAAPTSTYDLKLASGAEIPIEQRARKEIAEPYGKLCVPPKASVFNPAFDVTPAELISAHITERGVYEFPYAFV